MRLMRLLPLLACLGAPCIALAEPAPARPAATQDEVVARSFVPSPERRVGEVRLLRRGDANVVQTLLYTKLLRRVVGEIRQKELANWPEGPGHEDALRYVDALAAAQEELWGRLLAGGQVRDRRQKLWVEFVLTPTKSKLSIGAFEMEEEQGEVRVLRRETLAVLDPSREYVRRNMRLIASDSFHVEGAALSSLLEPLELLRGVAAPAGG